MDIGGRVSVIASLPSREPVIGRGSPYRYAALAALLIATGAPAAGARLTGTVTDAATGERLERAAVLAGSAGTSTDSAGRFSLEVDDGELRLTVRLVGYRTARLTLEIAGDRHLALRLHPSTLFLQGVTATAARSDPATLSLDARHVQRATTLLPDPLRSLATLPGVSTNNEFSAEYNVRGGNTDENLVLLDQVELYQPYHLKEAEFASVGIITMAMIRSMEFSPGGFTARYGDRMSSVADFTTRPGRTDRLGGSATLSMTYAELLAEGPLGRAGSFILSGRRSYLTYILRLLDYEESADPTFYDVHGGVTVRLGSAHSLRLGVLHAGDRYENNPGPFDGGSGEGAAGPAAVPATSRTTAEEQNLGRYYTTVVSLSSASSLPGGALLLMSAAFYDQIDRRRYRSIGVTEWRGAPGGEFLYTERSDRTSDDDAEIRALDAKTGVGVRIAPWYEIRSGAEYRGLRFRTTLTEERTVTVEQDFGAIPEPVRPPSNTTVEMSSTVDETNTFKAAAYLENILEAGPVMLNLGARADYLELSDELPVSPRAGASFQAGDVTVTAGWGHYYQFPNARQIDVVGDSGRAQRAVHYVLGIGRSIETGTGGRLDLRAEAYWKDYTHLIPSRREYDGRIVYASGSARGAARGIDLSAILRAGWYYGWLGYSYLDARETVGGAEYPRYTDQRHTVSLVSAFDLGSGWRANLRLAYGSGYAYAPAVLTADPETGAPVWTESSRNTAYLPAYSRVDVRLERAIALGAMTLELFVDVSNVFNAENVYSYRYGYDGSGVPAVEGQTLWPIIPSLGVTARF